MTGTAFILAASNEDWKLLDPQVADYLRLLLVLGAILVLAYVGVRYLLPRIGAFRQSAPGPMRVVARMPLEPGKNLYVIQAGTGRFLVGTSAAGIHYLAAVEMPAESLSTAEPKPQEFSRLMESRRGAEE